MLNSQNEDGKLVDMLVDDVRFRSCVESGDSKEAAARAVALLQVGGVGWGGVMKNVVFFLVE